MGGPNGPRVDPPESAEEVRTKLQDLINLRREKILMGMKSVDEDTISLDITNLSQVEIECIRCQSLAVLDRSPDVCELHRRMRTRPTVELIARCSCWFSYRSSG